MLVVCRLFADSLPAPVVSPPMGASSSAPAAAPATTAAKPASATAAASEAQAAPQLSPAEAAVAAEERRLTALYARALHAPLPPLRVPSRRASVLEALFLPSLRPDPLVRSLTRVQRVEDLPEEIFDTKAVARAKSKHHRAAPIPDDNGTVLMPMHQAQRIMWMGTSLLGCVGWEIALRRMPVAARVMPTQTVLRRVLPWSSIALINWPLQARCTPPKMREPVSDQYIEHVHTLQMINAMGIRTEEDAAFIEPLVRDRIQQHRTQQMQMQQQRQQTQPR